MDEGRSLVCVLSYEWSMGATPELRGIAPFAPRLPGCTRLSLKAEHVIKVGHRPAHDSWHPRGTGGRRVT
eukprot:2199145-Prymnesium_polylepis.1